MNAPPLTTEANVCQQHVTRQHPWRLECPPLPAGAHIACPISSPPLIEIAPSLGCPINGLLHT